MSCKFDLSDSEYLMMQFFWDSDETHTLGDIIKLYNQLENHKDLNSNTIKTFLTRLVNKGALTTTKVGHKLLYRRSMTRERYAQRWMKKFIADCFNGSLREMMLAITGGVPQLTEHEKEELRDFWNE